MRHDWRLVLGIFLTGAMVAVGCSGSSGTPDSGAGGGSSGSGGAKGAGGSSVDASSDHGPADAKSDTTGAAGADGGTDTHADVATDVAVDQASDTGPADVAADMAVDTGAGDVGPCVTNFGAGNPVQFAFNGGANGGWTVFQTHYTGNPDPNFTLSLAASFTEGHSCPGALLLGLNFASYGQSGAIEYYYGASPTSTPSSKNWTGYKALHAWVKIETATPAEVNGVNFYMKSGNQVFYQSAFAAGASLSDWHEMIIDLTAPPSGFNGVMINDVQQIGFETFLNPSAPSGGPTTPSQVLVLADDIWLEAAPAVDAGSSDAGDAQATDAQASDAGGQ